MSRWARVAPWLAAGLGACVAAVWHAPARWLADAAAQHSGGRLLLAPRAYKLPYTKNLHKQVDEGVRKGKDGISQMGTAEAKAGLGKGGGWLRPGNDEQEIKIRDLPLPQLPEK